MGYCCHKGRSLTLGGRQPPPWCLKIGRTYHYRWLRSRPRPCPRPCLRPCPRPCHRPRPPNSRSKVKVVHKHTDTMMGEGKK